jgi:pimeloyl-ACP methyl ester carboxylesterase
MSSTTKLIDVSPDVNIFAVLTQPAHLPKAGIPTLVFLHYWGGSSRTWSLVTPLLSSYPTVALDFRGWGNSTGPDEADGYSISALADDVKTVIEALQLHSVVLVGLSMGAKVAQLVAGRGDVSALKGLILISPAPATPLALPLEMREQQIHAYDNAGSAEFVARNVLTASFGHDGLPLFVVDDMLGGNSWAMEAWPSYGMAEDVSEVLGCINIPVMVVAAEKDQVEVLERVRTEVAERIPGARMEVLTGSEHLSPLDAPREVADQILRFLERNA